MAKITNFARGPRGITLTDGSTVWLEPGQSEDIRKDDIAGPLPDLGREPEVEEADSVDERVASLVAEIGALKAAVASEKAQRDDAEKLLADASAEIDALKAAVAKFDADGNGKPGGGRPAK